METRPKDGVMKKEKFPNTRKPSHRQVHGEFWNLRGQHDWEELKNKKKNLQNMRLTTTPSGELAQTLPATTSEWGLNRRHGSHD